MNIAAMHAARPVSIPGDEGGRRGGRTGDPGWRSAAGEEAPRRVGAVERGAFVQDRPRSLPVERIIEGEVLDEGRAGGASAFDPFARARFFGTAGVAGSARAAIAAYRDMARAAGDTPSSCPARVLDCYA